MFIDALKLINSNYNKKYNYSSPNPIFNIQSNWSTSFTALSSHSFNKDLSWNIIFSLFDSQWINGMLPHIVFHQKNTNYFPNDSYWNYHNKSTHNTSCISCPPLIISIVYWLTLIGDNSDLEKASILYHKLFRYLEWFNNERDIDNIGLIKIIHPWESCRDNSPDWDDGLKDIDTTIDLNIIKNSRTDILFSQYIQQPTNSDYLKYLSLINFGNKYNWNKIILYYNSPFQFVDPSTQFIFIRACKDFIKLSDKLNIHTYDDTVKLWIEKFTLGSQKLWSNKLKAYCSLNMKTNTLNTNLSSASFLSFFADVSSIKQKNNSMVNVCNFINNNNYFFPSWNKNSKLYNPIKYSRGATWVDMNFLISIGIYNSFQTFSQKILDKTKLLIEEHGFYEYFDPDTGLGYGIKNVTSTSSIYIILLNIQKYAFIFYN